MNNKMSPCCTRRVAQIARAEADLRTLARRIAKKPNDPRWADMVKRAKLDIARAKEARDDHEASHAGELVLA